MNEERLDYEIHVLRKHEEEIVLVKSEQKRKITVLQDTINKLRRKVRGMCIQFSSSWDSTWVWYFYKNLYNAINPVFHSSEKRYVFMLDKIFHQNASK